MKATLVFNTKEEPRVLLEMEDPSEEAAMAREPNLELVSIGQTVGKGTDYAYAIIPTDIRTRAAEGDSDVRYSDDRIAHITNQALRIIDGVASRSAVAVIIPKDLSVNLLGIVNQMRNDLKELEANASPKCPKCKTHAVNVGTEVTDDAWWCEGCEECFSI